MSESSGRAVAGAQAAYYTITGVWPLVHRRSFEAVTGPKQDYWLVETVGALVTSAGLALALGAIRNRMTTEIRLLGVAAALALAGVDIRHVASRRIRRVYLADAGVELALAACWALASRKPPPPRSADAAVTSLASR
jgi:hypothetical protein